jgi:hypothetical protein
MHKMSKVLVAFQWDCGRMGNVNGLFVTTTEELETLYGKEVYFGEILGKHSEIVGTVDRGDITVKATDPVFIDKLVEVMDGRLTISGYNPFDYLEEDDADEVYDAEDA